jgi:hypothetical protein
VEEDKDEHMNECNIHELPLNHTPLTTLPFFAGDLHRISQPWPIVQGSGCESDDRVYQQHSLKLSCSQDGGSCPLNDQAYLSREVQEGRLVSVSLQFQWRVQ